MNILVLYDSKYGNTEKIAQAIGETIGCQVVHIGEVNPGTLKGLDLIIIGSPTHGGFPTEDIHNLSKSNMAFHESFVAAFDTRTKRTIFGYAAPKIAKNFEKNGGKRLVPPEGFFVLGTKGPLADGELERAVHWAACLNHHFEETRNA